MFPQTPAQWAYLLGAMGAAPRTAAAWAEAYAAECTPERFSLGARELDAYLAETLHETARLTATVESLSYRARRICELGALYGPGSRWAKAAAFSDVLAARRDDGTPYPDAAAREQALAEVLYGGRFGNVNPGDGWKYRGRGIPMVTFAANYERLGDLMGQDLLVTPQLLEQPRFAVQASLLWWEDRIPDSAIEFPERVRKLVQGSTLGLDDTRKLAADARKALEAFA